MNTIRIKQIFQSKFDYQTYCNEIVHSIFGCNDVAIRPELLDTTAEGDECNYIGRMTDTDGRELGFFYTRVVSGSDVRRKRVGLRKMIAPYLKYDVDAAIAVFADKNHWRFSYICDMKEGVTNAKRFSYILGDEQGQYKTPLERLDNISTKRGRFVLNDLREAFSVDALSDEFFDEYHIHYDRIVAELARQGKTGALYHDYVKKLMGRIVFLHFLQKKGWLCGDTNFMLNTFSQSNRKNDYLESVLEPLFFGILNTEPAKREQVFSRNGWQQRWVSQWSNIPYLNGGLFERDAVDDLRIILPESIFSNLFSFLASYNFTVDENDPDDAEIGVDPEMLGKIFESLLEDNKAKGAFYTPKEIVRYMCKESLIAYLASKLPDVNDSTVRTFVEHHEMQPELEPCRTSLSQALLDVKICDPAIGSGAFPMGLLNELWRCREALEPTGSRVALKKEIIENNIYGVDIERGAIDIARLRFWLSIVVDSEQPEALPNFDYKFMQGNSLIESYQGCDLSRIAGKTVGRPSTSTQLVIGLDSDLSRKNLQRLLREYFSVTDHQQKANMRQAINDEVKTLIRESVGGTPTFLAKLEQLDPSANQDFFLWHTWFKDIFDKGGFDIVIGNPPYVDYRKIDETTKIGLNKFLSYQLEKKGSLYVYFIEQGIGLLKPNARLSFINPYQYLSAESGRGIRSFLIPKHMIERIVDVSNIKVFDEASTYTCINIIQKNMNQGDIRLSKPESLNNLDENITKVAKSTFIDKPYYTITLSTNSLVEKIEEAKYRLSDVCSIFCGLSKTGFRDYVSSTKEDGEYQIFVESKQILRYVTDSKKYIDTTLFSYNAMNAFRTPCLFMTRMTNHCRVALAKKGETAGKVNVLHNFKKYDILFVLALLNSKLVDYYYRITNESKHLNGGALPFDTESVKVIPIPEASKSQQEEIELIVKNILSRKQNMSTADTSSMEREIDRLVYQLYSLTEEEIAVIDG
jgi:type I restriction-modification system DNA methylase subunit